MSQQKPKVITICASASFYRDVIALAAELEQRGFAVKIPDIAKVMARNDDYRVERYKTWFQNPKDYTVKAKLMNEHFKKVIAADAILVVNKTKHGVRGYIGGNVLMEMAIAFERRKAIYILHDISPQATFKEEIFGMHPVFLKGDIDKMYNLKG